MKTALIVLVGFAPAALAQQGTSLQFDGIDDRIMVPHDPSFPTTVFTLTAWIRLSPPPGRAAIIARGEDNDSYNLSWQLYVVPNGTLTIMLEDATENNHCYPQTCMGQPQASCIVGDLFVADDTWHFVAATRDAAGTVVLYVDGEPQASCTQTGVPSSNNFQFLTIGCTHGMIGPPPQGQPEPPIWFLSGVIDEPAMWNVTLTDVQVQDVFGNGVNPAAPGLVGYWPFDEGSGQVVADVSPAANHGFLGTDDLPSGDTADPAWLPSECAEDVDDSGDVGTTDFLAILGAWGSCPGCPEDVTGDGLVDTTDFLAILAAWGPCFK
jgi:hypothetical protein